MPAITHSFTSNELIGLDSLNQATCGFKTGGQEDQRVRLQPSPPHGGEPGRGLITQRAMRPLGVVFISPRSRKHQGIPAAMEEHHGQELISQSAANESCGPEPIAASGGWLAFPKGIVNAA